MNQNAGKLLTYQWDTKRGKTITTESEIRGVRAPSSIAGSQKLIATSE